MGTCYSKKNDENMPLLRNLSTSENILPGSVNVDSYDNVSQWSEFNIVYHKAVNNENAPDNNLLIDNSSFDRECQFEIEINAKSP